MYKENSILQSNIPIIQFCAIYSPNSGTYNVIIQHKKQKERILLKINYYETQKTSPC